MLNLIDGMEPGTLKEEKLDSELVYLQLQWFKHFQLWIASYFFFSLEDIKQTV